jgi:Family of unknown function (DUF6069)
MTTPMMPQDHGRRPDGRVDYGGGRRDHRVDEGRLWSGGVATAVVAGLVALVGVLVARWLFNIPLLAPERDGAFGDAHTTAVVLVAAGAALLATGLLNLLLLSTPRPLTFFGWIVGLATVLVVIVPFKTSAALSAKAATAVVALVIGIAIGTLLSGAAARSIRRPAPGGGYDPIPPDTEL